MIEGPLRARGRHVASAMAAVAALIAAPASAEHLADGKGALVQGGAIMLPLGRAGQRPALMLHSGPAQDGDAAALRPWTLYPPASLAFVGEPGAGLAHFTPRLAAVPLGRAALGGDPAGGLLRPGGTEDGAGEGGRGIVRSYERPLEVFGEGLGLSLSAGFAARRFGPGVGSAMSVTFGVSGRLGIAGFSLGAALSETRLSGRDTGPMFEAAGHDLDLSYTFGSGDLRLTHFHGIGLDVLGRPADDPFERLSLSGRYAIGPGLDMTALLVYSDHHTGDVSEDSSKPYGWVLLAGFRLSF